MRKVYWAASIDFASLDIYVRKKKTRSSIAERYSHELSPKGNVYAETEGGALTAMHLVVKAYMEKLKTVEAVLAQSTVPVIDVDNIQEGGYVEYPWHEDSEPEASIPAEEPKPKKGRGRRKAA